MKKIPVGIDYHKLRHFTNFFLKIIEKITKAVQLAALF